LFIYYCTLMEGEDYVKTSTSFISLSQRDIMSLCTSFLAVITPYYKIIQKKNSVKIKDISFPLRIASEDHGWIH
jgi:hypothetical protein